MKLNVILLGATGMVGEGVLHVALQSGDVERVLVLGRRACGVSHPKLTEIIHSDLHDISALAGQLKGYHACFFCLGISSIGKSEDVYRRTTYDLTMHIARVLSGVNSDMTFCYVSGSGTDTSESGKQMWARVKGKTENDLRTLPFRRAFAFRPGFIKPIDGMKHTLPLTTTIGRFYPLLKRLFPNAVCTLESLGKAMIGVSINGYPKDIIDNSDIHTIAQK